MFKKLAKGGKKKGKAIGKSGVKAGKAIGKRIHGIFGKKGKKAKKEKKQHSAAEEDNEQNLITDSDLRRLDRAKHEDVVEILRTKYVPAEEEGGDPKPIDVDELALDKDGKTILISAASRGQIDTVRALCQEFKADVDEEDDNGNTALHAAAEKGELEVVKALIEEFEAEVDVENEKGETPLHQAARRARLDVVKALVEEHGALINAITKENETPYDVAPKSGKTDVAEYLQEKQESGGGGGAAAGDGNEEEEEEEEEGYQPVILHQTVGTTFRTLMERLFEFSDEAIYCREVSEDDKEGEDDDEEAELLAEIPVQDIVEVTERDDSGNFQLIAQKQTLDLNTKDDEAYEYFVSLTSQLRDEKKGE